jgi:hypothetical protein
MWLTGRLAPDFKTIADFRRDSGEAIRAVCRQVVHPCGEIGLIAGGTVAVDGSRASAATPSGRRRRRGSSTRAALSAVRRQAGFDRRQGCGRLQLGENRRRRRR